MEKLVSTPLGLVFSVVVLTTLALADQVTIPAQDVSSPGNPLAIAGSVQISETTTGRLVQTSISSNINAKNISSKTILALVVSIEVSPVHAAMRRSTKEFDCFFGPDVIKPGDQESFPEPSGRATTEPYDPSSSPRTPEANVRVLYVQFTDGSRFGDETFAGHLKELRRITLQNLRRLDRAYRRGGETAFVEELNETVSPIEVNNFLETIRRTQRARGTQAALAQVQTELRFAKEHQAGLGEQDDQ